MRGEQLIAAVAENKEDPSQADGSARLIAAAPELYKAGCKIIESWKETGELNTEAVSNLYNAVAKVEGQ